MENKEFRRKHRMILLNLMATSLAAVMGFILALVAINTFIVPLGEYGGYIAGIGVILIMIPFLNHYSNKLGSLVKECLDE